MDLEERVARLEAKLDVLDAMGRYCEAWDGHDPDAYAEMYTEDGVLESHIVGAPEPDVRCSSREEIRRWAREAQADHLVGVQTRHHHTGTLFLEVTPDSARTETMLLSSRMEDGDLVPWLTNQGVYRDVWRRTPDGWKLARREVHHDRREAQRPASLGREAAQSGRTGD